MKTFISRNGRFLLALSVLIVLFTAFISTHPSGASTYVLTIWANQGVLLALATIGQFFAVVVRGIDLSIGPTIALANVVASYLVNGSEIGIVLGFVAVLAISLLCGAINGVVIVFGRIQPIVATLATGAIYSGVALWLRPTPGGEISEGVSDFFTYSFMGIPTSLLVLIVLLFITVPPLRRSPLGLSMYAVGSAEQSAYLTGLRVGLVKLIAYSCGGLFAGLAGLYVSMVTLTGDAGIGPSYTLNSIAAVVIGGVALSGGVGGPVGAAIGALLLKTVSSLMFFTGLPPLAQPFFEGLILALSIALGSFGVFRIKNRLEVFDR